MPSETDPPTHSHPGPGMLFGATLTPICKSKCSGDASCSVCRAACFREFSVTILFLKFRRHENIDVFVFVSPHEFPEITRALQQRFGDEIIPKYFVMLISFKGPVAQWIRHRPTEPGIAGSSPAGVILDRSLETKVE